MCGRASRRSLGTSLNSTIPSDYEAAQEIVNQGGVPVGVIYKDSDRPSFQDRIDVINDKSFSRQVENMIESYAI